MLRLGLIVVAISFLISCGKPEPITIGFIGGLTGRTSDLGSHSRNGMILAVEEWNQRGGINGQPIQLLIKDDKQDSAQATAMVKELIQADVDVIVGPSTSSMAVSIAPLANEANIVMVGTTVTTNQLSDTDDTFFRTVASTKSSSRHVTSYLKSVMNISNFAIVQDLSNFAYTESWKNDFVENMTIQGAESVYENNFSSGDNLKLLEISQQLALLDTELIVLVTNATDAALLVKQIRSINQEVAITTAEWAGTNQFLQLAGRDAENIIVPRYTDESSNDQNFIELTRRYEARFQQEMGYPGLLAYNATQILLDALDNKASEDDVKTYLIQKGTFEGVLATFELNEYGDEIRNAFHFITQVKDGKYVTVEE
jgi:branched-chain amino acid transport system substrate-binding protein